MTHPIRHLHRFATVVAATMFLLGASASAALAGPVPIEPEAPPGQPAGSADGGGFHWMLTGAALLAALVVVAVIAVLWHRAHASGRRLATP
jgi:hypothetical protein